MKKQWVFFLQNKNTRIKKILVSVLFVIVIAGGIGIGSYYYFLAPTPSIERQLDESFGTDFFEDFDLEDEKALKNTENNLSVKTETEPFEEPGENKKASVKDDENNNTVQEEKEDNNHQAESNSANEEGTGPGDEKETARVTTDDIVKLYEPKIRSLEKSALDKLNTLFASAAEEYITQRKEGKVNQTELARKYLQAAVRLENNVDAKFYEILGAMEHELKEHQLSTSVISDIKKEYSKKKSEMRKQYLGSFKL